MVEVVRQSCQQIEARDTLRNRLVVWFTAMLTYPSVLIFHMIIRLYSVGSYVLFSPNCRRRFCGPVDVASMSGALVSGAHENVPSNV